MTQAELSKEFESRDSLAFKIFRTVAVLVIVALLLCAGALELAWPQQAMLAVGMVLIAAVMDRLSSSYLVTLTLMMVSMYATVRYAWWRWSMVTTFFRQPVSRWGYADAVFIALLMLAETYAFVVLVLGYLQMMWPLRRTPVELPEDPEEWPEIDLLIPTYNEPLSVVRYTALAANHIDWPADKLNVYLLDDGGREEFRVFAEEAGIGYVTRGDNAGAKAGNINSALRMLNAPLVAIFDADHIPTRSFLQVTVGWFLRDNNLGMLQTPHHFYSPDPFERNLGVSRAVPNESELFYGVVQDGNDFWNATLFCGSCAVLRRSALNEIGGVAAETVTEDAHTSLRMQMNGWNTAYINIPQAAGLATERLSAHVRQRIRWARGMIQILRTDNPLFARGLKGMQRLCYFNAMLHFLYGVPRLIFLFAPLVYLLFGRTAMPGYWAAILAYAVPHLVLSSITHSRIQCQHRHSFWNEIYETVMAPYIVMPTLLAMIHPRLGSFGVTPKGGVVTRRFFDSRIALPFLVMLACNAAGMVCAILRLWRITVPLATVPVKAAATLKLLASMYDGTHRGAILMNLAWASFNTVILGVACGVAWESQQRRQTVRVTMRVPVGVQMPNGILMTGVTADVSSGGARMIFDDAPALVGGERVRIQFSVLDGEESLPATVVKVDGTELRAHFDTLSMTEEEALTQVLYTRADTWLRWNGDRETDRPLQSLWRIAKLAMRGLGQALRSFVPRSGYDRDDGVSIRAERLRSTVVPLALLLGVGLALAGIALTVPARAVIAGQGVAKPLAATASKASPGDTLQDVTGGDDPSAFAGNPLPLQDDLAQLPLPFYDSAERTHDAIAIAFLKAPSTKAMQAAGVIASTFGVIARNRGVRFAVSVGAIPVGNAIVIVEDVGDLPVALHVESIGEPVVAIRSNPSDPSSNVLVVTGDVMQAAQGFALRRDAWTGDTAAITPQHPATSVADDAPGWRLANGGTTASGTATHFTELPALELFARGGFPFTRYKNLSETTVVLPEHPGADEIELFLALVAHLGAATGSPAIDLTATAPDGLKANGSRDYMVIGTVDDQAAFSTLNNRLPVQIRASGLAIAPAWGLFAPLERAWHRLRYGAEPELAGAMPDAVIEEMEWPRGSKRSVVAIALRDHSVTPTFVTAFSASPLGIAESVSVLRGGRFVPYRVGTGTYRIGSVPPLRYVQLFLSSYPMALLAVVMLACFALATVMRVSLRRRAWLRLQGEA